MDLTISLNSGGTQFDINAAGYDLSTDSGLRSVVIVSLFSDRRANADDTIPDGTTNLRGSWLDTYPELSGHLIGSRLWLLSREKELPEVLPRTKLYAEEALQWLIERGVANAVEVTPEWVASRRGVLGLHVLITLPDGSNYSDVFNYTLEAA